MDKASTAVVRTRKFKVAGAGAAIGAGVLLSACFGPGTIANQIGTGTAGYTGDGGPATSATLSGPQGVVVDGAGNAYVADTNNCVVRKYTASTAKISAFAGNGTCSLSGDGGAATAATLNHPIGLALNGTTLYVADADNNRIRAISLSTNVISTYAGTTLGGVDGNRTTTAKFRRPVGVAIDGSGDLLVADSQNHAIRKVDHTTNLVGTVAGTLGTSGSSGDEGAAGSALLNDPEAIAVDQYGEIFIADAGNCRVRWIDGGSFIHVLGGTTCGYSGDGADAALAKFSHMRGLAVDPDLNVYVSDTGNNRVREISGLDNSVTTVIGTGVAGSTGDDGAGTKALINGAAGLAILPHTTLWVADTGNNRVRILGLTPLPTTTTTPATTSTSTSPTTTTVAT